MDARRRRPVRSLVRRTRCLWLRCPSPEQYMINHDHRFVYCAIPKNANSSLKSWFLEIAGEPLEHEHADQKHDAMHPYKASRQPAKCVRRAMQEYFKFVFVRNPWDRLTSAYLNKFVQMHEGPDHGPLPLNMHNKPLIESYWKLRGRQVRYDASALVHRNVVAESLPIDSSIEYERGVTFREFVEVLCATPDRELNPHWRPQACFTGHVRFDMTGRVENLAPDLSCVETKLGLHGTLKHDNRSSIPGSLPRLEGSLADIPPSTLRGWDGLPGGRRLWTPELVERVAERYAEDVERYGYADAAPDCEA